MDQLATSSSSEFSCQFYETARCDPSKMPCDQAEKCGENKGMQRSCFAVWSNNTSNGMKLSLQGCWLAQDAEHNNCNQEKCIADKSSDSQSVMNGVDYQESTYFCCCNKPMCNERFEFVPPRDKEGNLGSEGVPAFGGGMTGPLAIVTHVFVPIFGLMLICLASYFIYRRYKLRKEAERAISIHANGGLGFSANGSSSPSAPLKSIQLAEMIAKGRYGTVWKGRMGENNLVAVKIFPSQDADSWSQEQVIYGVPGLKDQPNILRFIGAEVRGVGVRAEYWLITALQENGSLHDYLKNHTITLTELFRISNGMLRGLVFLHEEGIGTGGEHSYKPAIVHRDIKSRNVLLNKDLNACIADFGLAVKCVQGRTPVDVHSQVGTRRYMSPEVLEGATDFNAFAFRQIDVYAAALVLWETVSRCTFVGEVGEFKLPFDEVGVKPSLADLQEYVVVKKKRPQINEKWRNHSQGAVICTTIEEMWDTEPEARITAGCALARLTALHTSFQEDSTKSIISSYAVENDTKVQGGEGGDELRRPLILDASSSQPPPVEPEVVIV